MTQCMSKEELGKMRVAYLLYEIMQNHKEDIDKVLANEAETENKSQQKVA